MGYKTTRDVHYNGKLHPSGKTISFRDGDEDVRDQLLALSPPAIEGEAEKQLERMTKGDLARIAEAESIELADGATQAQMVDAIKAARAAA